MFVLQSKQTRIDEKSMAEIHLQAMAAQGIGEWRPEAFLNEQTEKREEKAPNESDESENEAEKSGINKKLGAGPFRSQTREEIQSVTGYLRPKYEFTDIQN